MNDINTLKDLLIDCLIQDLMNEEKRSPSLYQVVARVIAENKPTKEALPSADLEDIVPFKIMRKASS